MFVNLDPRRHRFTQDRQRGVALISVLLALLLITLLGLALTGFGILAVGISTNEREGTEALYVAEAGITHARRLIVGQQMVTFSTFLQNGNGTACDGDELSPAPGTPFQATDNIPAAGVAFPPAGRYRVFVCDDAADTDPLGDSNGTILVRSVGTGRNSATATLEITISQVPLPGLLVDGNLRLNGNPVLTGPGGAVHSNGALQIPGNPCAAEYISSSTTITGGGTTGPGCPGSDSPVDKRPGQPPIPIPPITPDQFRNDADFRLGNDGRIRDNTGAVIAQVPSPPNAGCVDDPPFSGANKDQLCWDPGNRIWEIKDNPLAGTYYADNGPSGANVTNIKVPGNPGTLNMALPPLALTLIATGSIEISGNARVQPDLTGVSMVAGTDLKINGNPGTIFQGLHFAGHQVDFSGNPVISGQVIADNQADFGTPQNLIVLKAGGFMEISGNATINYSGAGGLNATTVVAWRECRGANPANPCL